MGLLFSLLIFLIPLSYFLSWLALKKTRFGLKENSFELSNISIEEVKKALLILGQKEKWFLKEDTKIGDKKTLIFLKRSGGFSGFLFYVLPQKITVSLTPFNTNIFINCRSEVYLDLMWLILGLGAWSWARIWVDVNERNIKKIAEFLKK